MLPTLPSQTSRATLDRTTILHQPVAQACPVLAYPVDELTLTNISCLYSLHLPSLPTDWTDRAILLRMFLFFLNKLFSYSSFHFLSRPSVVLYKTAVAELQVPRILT